MSKKIKTPSTTIFVRPELAKNETLLHKWQHLLKETFLEDVLVPESVEILWEPDPTKTSVENETDQTIVRLHSIFHEAESIYSHSRWVIRAKLNKLCLVDRGLTPKDVAHVLREHFNLSSSHNVVNASETYMEEWIIRFRIPGIFDMVKDSAPNGDEKSKMLFERDLCLSILYELSRTLRISGIAGISGSTSRKELGNTIIDTKGSNMLDLWMLDGCDWTKTVSNVLQEVHEFLGIEAASEMLFYEFKTVMTMASANISDRHLLILMDVMTRHGYLVPINRHGFNQLNNAFARASFEETVDNLIEAAMFAEIDPMTDIVSNMAVGQIIPAGTGRVHTMLNSEYAKTAQIEMSHVMPLAEEGIIMTSIQPSIRDFIERDNIMTSKSSEDPLADWNPPLYYSSDGEECEDDTIKYNCDMIEPENDVTSSTLFSSDDNWNRRFSTTRYINGSNQMRFDFNGTYKLPAYRPSSPQTFSSIAHVQSAKQRKQFSYHPSSPQSSQDTHLSPRGMSGINGWKFTKYEENDENFVILPQQALTEEVLVMEHPRRMDPMFTPLTR